MPRETGTFRLGEPSPVQESTSQGPSTTFTVTPTRVVLGTSADMRGSGVELDAEDGPQVPVFVWSTFTHKGGAAMRLGDMDNDLVLKTSSGLRTRALIILLGQAKWPDCPAYDTDLKLGRGQSEKVCSTFLIPEGVKPSAVELTQGFYKKPLQWPVRN